MVRFVIPSEARNLLLCQQFLKTKQIPRVGPTPAPRNDTGQQFFNKLLRVQSRELAVTRKPFIFRYYEEGVRCRSAPRMRAR